MVACRPMRALVPLMTAAALALAGWLASGVVTVRSLHAPARIGLLPPLPTLVALLLPLLALSWVQRAAAASPRRSWSAFCLLIPVALPWLPLPLLAGWYAWTGPLALAWWAASVAYVYGDALARLGRPWRTALVSPRTAPTLASLMAGVLLSTAAWHTAPQHPRGDEPDYLVITQSLWLDGDLAIENNHARADYASYHPGVLPPSYLARGADGAIYSVHAPGLPALLVPGFAVAGYRGAVATLVLIAMAGAWLAWVTAWRLTRAADASWVAVLATLGAAPFFLHGAAIFPDAPASVLALYVVSVLLASELALADTTGAVAWPHRVSLFGTAVALGLLPWLHTRYAVIAIGLAAMACLQLVRRRDVMGVAIFVTPAALLALAWFGLFWFLYGTPDPSAPYGTYAQMAVAHLGPGLPGLLVDQQFGLLASAPVLAVAVVALRPAVRAAHAGAWRVGTVVLGLTLVYTCVVGAYRMWWGGMSAPARFLVPLVLPLAPFIALGWHSMRTRASRHLVLTLLALSLALTAVLVCVDHGALAYNLRDGRARWAVWASPLVDLVSALPAAHRDAPLAVWRDAVVWLAGVTLAWTLWRAFERRGRLSPAVALVTVAVLLPATSASVRAMRGVNALAPAASQVRYLERRAAHASSVLMTITPPPVGRTRTWFEVEIDSGRSTAASAYDVLRVDALPAGRYRLMTDVRAPGGRLGVTLGDKRTTRFLADLDTTRAQTSAPFDLALPVQHVVVRGSRDAVAARGRSWLHADEVWRGVAAPPATQTFAMGGMVWLLPEVGIYPEADGAWLAGDADVTVGLPSSAAFELSVSAGAVDVAVRWSGSGGGEVQVPAGAMRLVTVTPAQGRLRLQTRGGFRPSQVSLGSRDQRYLGAWVMAPR